MNPPSRSDPAERHAFVRLFWWCGLGLPPRRQLTLQLPRAAAPAGSASNVLVVARHDGNRCVMSMLGHRSERLLNVRAAGR